MSIRKKAIREWPDEKAREYLNTQCPNEKITWFITNDEGLYGFKTSDGTEFVQADDDDIRCTGIIEFIKRNGGVYVSG
ncbi:MAG: hypothetical protein OER87_19300 [Gammaproteobacteria bacterium]|nr:hypothetical protein [Gammaproteobacteria bacterium]MDH3537898.1 hypothetical protein [Gammaproteobacteria bacterium]